MAKKRISDVLIEVLANAGIERIYGITGDSLNSVNDSLRRNGKIAFEHVRHEETAAFAAGAEASLTHKLTVCAGSSGPGNLHLINGLFDCHRNRVPVLAIASHIPQSEVGLNYFQETHPENLFKECSCFCELVSNPKQMPEILFLGTLQLWKWKLMNYLCGTHLVYLILFHNEKILKKWRLI